MRLISMTGIGLALIMSAGCAVFSGAKAGYKVIKGAEANIIPVKYVSGSQLQPYRSIRLGEVTTDVDSICTSGCLAYIKTAMQEAFAQRLIEAFPGGEKKLTVNIACRFFKEKPLIGNEARLDLLVSLVDESSGQEIGRLYIEGVSESPRARKAKDLAEENARELAKYLTKLKEAG